MKLTIILESDQVPNPDSVFIVGNHQSLGEWNPGLVKMQSLGNNQWKFEDEFPLSTVLKFKFTLGSWPMEATNKKGEPFADNELIIKNDTTLFFAFDHWGHKIGGQITGRVAYHRNISANGLLARDLIVWLPPGYEDSETQYPVLYMQDGQNIIDPNTSAWGKDWQLDETADSLISNDLTIPFIIVGIYNTTDRSAEYLPKNDSINLYMNLIIEHIKPLIDQNHRTRPDENYIGGSSAGATVSFLMHWKYPKIFKGAICMSPAFWIDDPDYGLSFDVTTLVSNEPGRKQSLRLYIDNGSIELENFLQEGVDKMLIALEKAGYKENKDYLWVKDIGGKHNEVDWARRAPLALMFLFSTGK